MSYPINYPTPQGANVQIFSQGGTTTDWVKPQGASFVWFTLIGAGGGGDTTSGGGSGAVTNFMGPAFLIPDVLSVTVGKGGILSGASATNTTVNYQQKATSSYLLLQANSGGNGGTAASATNANYFSAMGFYQSIAGIAGSSAGGGGGGVNTAPTTSFLTGGGGATGTVTPNYGYPSADGTGAGGNGFFQIQPIIVSRGGSLTGKGGTGSGGGRGGNGGDGLVVIITW